MTYNVSRDPYDGRVVDVQVLCTECQIPKYEPLDEKKIYRIVATDYLVSGGDGYDVLKKYAMNITEGKFSVVIGATFGYSKEHLSVVLKEYHSAVLNECLNVS